MYPLKKRTLLAMGNMAKQILATRGAAVVRWGKGPQPCELSVVHWAVLTKVKNP